MHEKSLTISKENLQSARKSESPNTNPIYDVAIARSENTSIIGCKFVSNIPKNGVNYKPLWTLNFFGWNPLKYKELTPTTPLLVARNCCNGSTIWSEPVPRLEIDPKITAFHTRNRPSGIAVPTTIAVLH